MAAELQKVRHNQEQLRTERRQIFDKLREVSKGFNELVEGDARLVSIMDEMAALVERGGQLFEDLRGGGAPSTAGCTMPPCRLGSASTERVGSAIEVVGLPESVETLAGGSGGACHMPGEQDPLPGDGDVSTTECPNTPRTHLPDSPRSTQLGTPRGLDKLAKPRSWDGNSQWCGICAKVFGLVVRRHHCRSCGRNVCDRCSPYRVCLVAPLPHPVKGVTGPHRVCLDCHEPV